MRGFRVEMGLVVLVRKLRTTQIGQILNLGQRLDSPRDPVEGQRRSTPSDRGNRSSNASTTAKRSIRILPFREIFGLEMVKLLCTNNFFEGMNFGCDAPGR